MGCKLCPMSWKRRASRHKDGKNLERKESDRCIRSGIVYRCKGGRSHQRWREERRQDNHEIFWRQIKRGRCESTGRVCSLVEEIEKPVDQERNPIHETKNNPLRDGYADISGSRPGG